MFESLSAYKNVYRELLISPQQDWLNWHFYIFETFTKKKKQWNWSFPPLSRNKIYQFSRLDFSPCSLWASSEVSQLSVFPVWTVVGVFTHNATEISPENILQGIRVLALSLPSVAQTQALRLGSNGLYLPSRRLVNTHSGLVCLYRFPNCPGNPRGQAGTAPQSRMPPSPLWA